jgi:hypothetical protein
VTEREVLSYRGIKYLLEDAGVELAHRATPL